MKPKPAVILLLCFSIQSCFHTAKVTQKFTAGSSLRQTDVILFTGYNGRDSDTSGFMYHDTQRILSKCGIKVVNMYDPQLNYEFLKAGFTPIEPNVDSDEFINKMKEIYGITHIFSIGSVGYYNGRSMNVERADLVYGGSGVIFEVYDLSTETNVASMKIKGRTWRLHSDGAVDNYPEGSIHTNYLKGLKTLMKSSICR